jgi:hypothetical protein
MHIKSLKLTQISEKIKENKHLIYRDRTCITAFEDFLERAVKERPEIDREPNI